MHYFSKKLKGLRTLKGLQQQDVAEDLGLHKNTYHHYESGRSEPPFEVLIKIAEYYNISIDELIGLSQRENCICNLTKDELELIKYYRQCDSGAKGRLLGNAETYAEQNTKTQVITKIVK